MAHDLGSNDSCALVRDPDAMVRDVEAMVRDPDAMVRDADAMVRVSRTIPDWLVMCVNQRVSHASLRILSGLLLRPLPFPKDHGRNLYRLQNALYISLCLRTVSLNAGR
jgi:hypothetical protein